MEDTFINFTLARFVEMMYKYNLIEEEEYNLFTYGSEQLNHVKLMQYGLNFSLIKRLEKDNQLDNLEFDDYPGNNMYNSLGNIYINPNVNIIVVDFKENKILHISGEASTVIQEQNEKKKIKVKITTTNIKLEKNSFSLKYDK